MYQVQSPTAILRGRARVRAGPRARARVSSTVLLLGLTSLLTDISSEMVSAVLPLYLVIANGYSPLAFGMIDGLYQGGAALVRVGAGFVGDRWRRHKEVATAGYGVSAACRLALLTAGSSLGAIGAIVLADRTGKGIRTAPRDALISLTTEERNLGTAFGVHRAMDTTGAMLGPLLAFAILAAAPLAFHSLFLVSLCFAVVGLMVIALFVRNPVRGCSAAAASARCCWWAERWRPSPPATTSSTSRPSASSTSMRAGSRSSSSAPPASTWRWRCRSAVSPTAPVARGRSSPVICCWPARTRP
jgi:hypothetical protein